MKLIIDNISKKYKDKWAVKDFSAELTNGVYGLLGPNGAGKTTLMRVLVDILQPTHGRILLDGKDIQLMGDEYRDILGYLPQHFGFYKNFSAHRFLMYIAALKGLDKAYAKQRTEALLKLVNLENEGKRKIGSFSGGMKQRLGIAQALLNDPKILILDEPTSGLDPKERVRFRNIISEISGDRIVILSTHIVSDVEYIAKEIILIKNGELVKMDFPQNIIKDISGKVWTAKVTENELDNIKKIYPVGNIARKEDGIEVRVISQQRPFINAIESSPGLEDIYMYYFGREEEALC